MNLDAAHTLATYTAGYEQLGQPGSVYAYVLEHGRPMEPGRLARHLGPTGFCFRNAGRIALRHPDRYAYCEGFALSVASERIGCAFLVQHAWILDRHTGETIECTWPDGAHSYYGIEFAAGCYREALTDCGTWDVLDHVIRSTRKAA